MSDYSELKRLSEAATPGPWAYEGSYVCPARTEDGTTYVELWRSIADCHQPENTKFIAAANPAAVLELIAEVEGLRAQHGRDSAELRSLCQARDDARKERDQLKEEVEALRKLGPSKEIIWCACGDGYPVNSYGAGFMDANEGVCANCDAALGQGEQS